MHRHSVRPSRTIVELLLKQEQCIPSYCLPSRRIKRISRVEESIKTHIPSTYPLYFTFLFLSVMQLHIATTLSSRLALVLVLALLSYCASAIPHPHTRRCVNPVPNGYDNCKKAEDCCAFSYCQATRGIETNLGISGVSANRDSA